MPISRAPSTARGNRKLARRSQLIVRSLGCSAVSVCSPVQTQCPCPYSLSGLTPPHHRTAHGTPQRWPWPELQPGCGAAAARPRWSRGPQGPGTRPRACACWGRLRSGRNRRGRGGGRTMPEMCQHVQSCIRLGSCDLGVSLACTDFLVVPGSHAVAPPFTHRELWLCTPKVVSASVTVLATFTQPRHRSAGQQE